MAKQKTSPTEQSADAIDPGTGEIIIDAPGGRAGLGKLPQLIGLVVGLLLAAGVYYYFFVFVPEVPPEFRLKQALRYLDEKKNQPARGIALQLQDIGYQDPDFAGGVAFVLGIAAYREAQDYDEDSREQRYILAANFLKEAERLALIAERRPEWAYALGLSLHRVGSVDEALPLLEEAVSLYAPGRIEASLLLADTYLYSQTTKNAEKALLVNTAVLADKKVTQSDQDRAYLQRAQILLMLGRRTEAEQAVKQGDRGKENSGSQASTVLRAQTRMAEGDYKEALKILEPLANDAGLERLYPGQAYYLKGLCAERLAEINKENKDELENAVSYYRNTVERFERSHEALAARLGAAEALRKLGRNEAALEDYATVLRSIRRPQAFRNRWISLKRLRETVLEAWNGWVENDFYKEAIVLSEMMPPVFPRDQAYELAARANQRWAEHLEGIVARLPYAQQMARQEEIKLRWKEAGDAYARLADLRKAQANYSDAIWISAEDYLKGHNFPKAVEFLTEFIGARNSVLLPTAMVRRGQAYLDMDRTEEALRDFRDTITAHPTDPAAFQARYLIGQCHLERGELDLAERHWRKILESNDLSPTALEWRKSLFSLGKLLYNSGDMLQRTGKRSAGAPKPTDAQDGVGLAQPRFEEAILRLEEFLGRYPTVAESAETRYLLAKALQRSADLPREKLRTAETDNARAEYRRQMAERLERAVKEFRLLQEELKARKDAETLDGLGQVMQRNSYLELANSYFSLGKYEDAIVAYTNCAGNYQQEPSSLTAYVQIANCYDRLKKPTEAISTLAQAKLILKQLPDTAFPKDPGTMSRDDWQRWLEWAISLHN